MRDSDDTPGAYAIAGSGHGPAGTLLQFIRSKYTYKFKKAAPLPGACVF